MTGDAVERRAEARREKILKFESILFNVFVALPLPTSRILKFIFTVTRLKLVFCLLCMIIEARLMLNERIEVLKAPVKRGGRLQIDS